MKCEDCKVEMEEGFGLIPVWGTLDGRPVQNGTTLSMVSGAYGPVMKCPECGHSVYHGRMIIATERRG